MSPIKEEGIFISLKYKWRKKEEYKSVLPVCMSHMPSSSQQTLGCINSTFLTSPNYTLVWPVLRYPTVPLCSLPEKPEGIICLNSCFFHTSHLDEHRENNYRIHTALKIHKNCNSMQLALKLFPFLYSHFCFVNLLFTNFMLLWNWTNVHEEMHVHIYIFLG